MSRRRACSLRMDSIVAPYIAHRACVPWPDALSSPHASLRFPHDLPSEEHDGCRPETITPRSVPGALATVDLQDLSGHTCFRRDSSHFRSFTGVSRVGIAPPRGSWRYYVVVNVWAAPSVVPLLFLATSR
jgi:hypothetical protein